jgi:hypothetical protein
MPIRIGDGSIRVERRSIRVEIDGRVVVTAPSGSVGGGK